MNKASYNSLPDDLKRIIDDHSGAEFAKEMGELWDNVEPEGIQLAKDKGNTVSQLSMQASTEFATKAEEVGVRWLDEVTSNGIDGAALLEKAQNAVSANTMQK